MATAAETRNTHFAFEAIEPPGGGTPLHTHAGEEEFFLVLEGEMTFYVGGRVISATEGQTAFVRRGVPHCFKNCSRRESRVLVLFTPGNIEGLFEYGNLPGGMPAPTTCCWNGSTRSRPVRTEGPRPVAALNGRAGESWGGTPRGSSVGRGLPPSLVDRLSHGQTR